MQDGGITLTAIGCPILTALCIHVPVTVTAVAPAVISCMRIAVLASGLMAGVRPTLDS